MMTKKVVRKEDIETTKKVIRESYKLALFMTSAIKEGLGMGHLFRGIHMLGTLTKVIRESKTDLMPELRDLDRKEAEELSGLLYEAIQGVIKTATKEKK
tara:strand:+ start:209 stop:505 length:297 start_codon:yes stop_codon:yes gene_type:complete